jgi:hypothetical protein
MNIMQYNLYKNVGNEILQYLKQLPNMEFVNYQIIKKNEDLNIHYHVQPADGIAKEAVLLNIENTISFICASENYSHLPLDNTLRYTIHLDKDYYFFKSLRDDLIIDSFFVCPACKKKHFNLSVIYCDKKDKDCPEKIRTLNRNKKL